MLAEIRPWNNRGGFFIENDPAATVLNFPSSIGRRQKLVNKKSLPPPQ